MLGSPQKTRHISGTLRLLLIPVVIQEANTFALKSLAAPNWPFSYSMPLGKIL